MAPKPGKEAVTLALGDLTLRECGRILSWAAGGSVLSGLIWAVTSAIGALAESTTTALQLGEAWTALPHWAKASIIIALPLLVMRDLTTSLLEAFGSSSVHLASWVRAARIGKRILVAALLTALLFVMATSPAWLWFSGLGALAGGSVSYEACLRARRDAPDIVED